MVRRIHAIAALAGSVLAVSALPALAGETSYSFAADAASSAVTPAAIGIATFSSPGDPGAYTFGPNAGLFSTLGPYVLSSAGVPASLTISFSVPQNAISFDFALADFLAGGGNDVLTVTTNTGVSLPVTAALVGSDFYPEGSASLSEAQAFSSVTLTSAYGLVVADVTSVPEPASLALLGAGLLGLAATRRRWG